MPVQNPAGSPVEQEWRTLLVELGLDQETEREFSTLGRATQIELIIEDLDRSLTMADALVKSCTQWCSQDCGPTPRAR
jgi:hypothetical protein